MRNPFDKNFFRFLLGFSFILVASFAVLFFAGRYSIELDEQASSVLSADKSM